MVDEVVIESLCSVIEGLGRILRNLAQSYRWLATAIQRFVIAGRKRNHCDWEYLWRLMESIIDSSEKNGAILPALEINLLSSNKELNTLQTLLLSLLLSFFTVAAANPQLAASVPPAVGDKAPDFTLATIQGKKVRLSDLTAKSPVVLVVLRGFPGYQCPVCNQQVHGFLKQAQDFANAGARIVLVYPGPTEKLDERAMEFLTDKKLPDNFDLLLDPGYVFTNLYGLRWDAPKETAYPSTFLIDPKGIVFFAKISKTHGGRASAAELIEALAKKKMEK